MADAAGGQAKGDEAGWPKVEVFLVFAPVRFPIFGRPSHKVLAVKLNRKTAQDTADLIPNAYVDGPYTADKAPANLRTLPRNL